MHSFEVSVNPNRLISYNIQPLELYEAISKSNLNVGGDIIVKNSQAYAVRGIGLINNIEELGNIVVKNINGISILVKHLAEVKESSLPRLGQVGLMDNEDVIEGIVMMRKEEDPGKVIESLKIKIDELNTSILPKDVEIKTFYDREDLVDLAVNTVSKNLIGGMLFVMFIVMIFMADWRTTFIVSIIIPLSLLFAFICLHLKGMSANLLSLGAIDFGIIVDGAVVMVEGIFVTLDKQAKRMGMKKFNLISKSGIIRNTAKEMGKPVFFAKLIIITALMPIFAFQKVEGMMFSPLAYTLGFALLGALVFTLTLVPVLSNLLLKKNVKEKSNFFLKYITNKTLSFFKICYKHKKIALSIAAGFIILGLFTFKFLGSEFLPQLNEGSIYIRATLPQSISLKESVKIANKIRQDLRKHPEVNQVISQTGRPNDGTDPTGFYNIELLVSLHPQKEWESKLSKEELIGLINDKLETYPGIDFNFSQPITDNVEEAVSGVKGSIVVKTYGSNLYLTEKKSNEVYKILKTVDGIEDLGLIRNIGQPELRIELKEDKLALYGVTKETAQSIIEMAIGGKTASYLYEDEKKFDIVVRYQEEFRKSEKEIGNIIVPTMSGSFVRINELADIKTIVGPLIIFRDNHTRFSAVKFSVRGRDMGSAIKEAQEKVNASVKLPKGYTMNWTGDFENQQRATNRLKQVVPISILLIFLILFILFGNIRDSALTLINVFFAAVGGIMALYITNTNFSISAGIGFIALFGICIQNGVIMISVIKSNLRKDLSLEKSLVNGIDSRVRPIIMTAMMAAIGLLPAALSTGIGSEAQKPLAIVIIGGLISATILILFIFPLIIEIVYKKVLFTDGKLNKKKLDR